MSAKLVTISLNERELRQLVAALNLAGKTFEKESGNVSRQLSVEYFVLRDKCDALYTFPSELQ